jgi:hypothetical protein
MVTLRAKLLKTTTLQAPEISEIAGFLQGYSDQGEFRIKHDGREPRAFIYDGLKKMVQFFLDPKTHILKMNVDGNYQIKPEILEDLKDFLLTIGFSPEGNSFVKNKSSKMASTYEDTLRLAQTTLKIIKEFDPDGDWVIKPSSGGYSIKTIINGREYTFAYFSSLHEKQIPELRNTLKV